MGLCSYHLPLFSHGAARCASLLPHNHAEHNQPFFMAKTLIIAEKPSVATDIARVLGGFKREGDFFESEEYVLSSAVGHLLEIAAPEEYEVKRGKWSFAHLPVIPPHFDLHPIAKNEARLKLLAKLAKRKDVTALINACDAGREGELIFRYIVQATKTNKPASRLWLQSMTPAAIRDAFTHLRADDEMQPLADAARSRSEADWLIGINGTRAMTAFNSKSGGFFLTTVGRVQTPTLMIVVHREQNIRRFVPRNFWEVRATFGASAGNYEGRWIDPVFKRDENDAEKRETRIWTQAGAEAVAADCRGKPGTVAEQAKPSTQLSPLLYDLTSLQREANGRFGLSAKVTLSIAQELYEKHKALTYPRTDSRHLPEDYLETVETTLQALATPTRAGARKVVDPVDPGTALYGDFAREILTRKWVRPNRRIFDNTKVSDHFAIIPTPQPPKNLNELQQKVYDLIMRRFMAVFYPAAEYLLTTRITTVARHQFKTEGRILIKPGWLAVYGREEQQENANLPAVAADEKPLSTAVDVLAQATRPPARYSEATLLSAMEGAGKLIEDDELREAMAEKGLGTPATRAAIIERLIAEKYLVREGRELIPTAKAFQLMTLLQGLGVNELSQPELTGEWEYKLLQMERGKLKRATFMKEIARITDRIVKRAKEYDSDTIPGDYATLVTPCPQCGGTVKENYRRYACEACTFSITKVPGGRPFEQHEAEQLLRDRTIGPLQGFRSKQGRPFAAILRIVPDTAGEGLKLEFDFGQNDPAGGSEPVDFSGSVPLGPCPKCGGEVYEHGMSYVCANSVGPERSCDFRSGKIILQRPIEPAEMGKLLATGKTDLLHRFVSRKGRPFSAYLVRGSDRRIGFEFEPKTKERKPKAAAARKTAG